MADNNGKDNTQGIPLPRAKRSRVTVEFEFVGSANFTIHPENITPMQLLALGHYMVGVAERQLFHFEARKEDPAAGKLVVAKMGGIQYG